jgi:hypothetical protein
VKEFLTAVEECVRGTAVLEDMIFRRLPVVGNRLDRVFCTNRGVERSGQSGWWWARARVRVRELNEEE